MQRIIKILSLFFCLVFYNNTQAQCTVSVDIANIQHIDCPNGGAVGSASIIQDNYVNYWWENLTTGQTINAVGSTTLSNLDAGLYYIYATDPYNSSCPWDTYSSTFEIIEANPAFQFNPTQACPNLCNVSISASMDVAISGVTYSYQLDNNTVVSLPSTLQNQCGGMHTYEIFADGNSCGVENIGVSQFAQMNLQTTVVDQLCTQPGSATVNITGVGASALSTYCNSSPQWNQYSIIELVNLNGDSYSINNNTSGVCGMYTDYTNLSADVTPGNSYSLDLNLGTCHPQEALVDIANVFIDWNIDGDFDDSGELVGQISLTQSPSVNLINFTVPNNAIPGQSRMRIVSQNYQYQNTNQAGACDFQAWFGETEDYTIVITGSVATPVSYLWSDGQITQTATNLVAGTYYVTITDANGCTASDTAFVVGTGNVSVTASVDQTICNGGTPSSLSASSGGGVAGSYSWADDSNPSVVLGTGATFSPSSLISTITYRVTFTETSSGCIAIDNVTITVNPEPEIPIITAYPDPVCEGDSITLTAVSSQAICDPVSSTSCYEVDVTITTDNNGSEISWDITDNTGAVLASGGPYVNGVNTYTITACLALGVQLDFNWHDSAGDGWNDGANQGTYKVMQGGATLTQGSPSSGSGGMSTLGAVSSSTTPICTSPLMSYEYRFQYRSPTITGTWANVTSPAWDLNNPVTYGPVSNDIDFRVQIREASGCTIKTSPWITVPVNMLPITGPIWHN